MQALTVNVLIFLNINYNLIKKQKLIILKKQNWLNIPNYKCIYVYYIEENIINLYFDLNFILHF